MDMQSRIAQDSRADRIKDLIKRCRFRLIQARYALSLTTERLQASEQGQNCNDLRELLHRSTRSVEILNSRAHNLAGAYIDIALPSEARHA